ncbi:MAG: hydrolase 2, exosortase A system-associated, partial [Pseudomonadota bacterium]|nr:hydrolase 2, exosortase A system-associated [Pseudomonadota bacterium]
MRALFLNGPSGNLFSAIYSAERPQGSSSWVLFIPPFAEELNKCRPMVSAQARALAKNGHNVLVADLFGTGDSDGHFSEVDWSLWKQDLCFLVDWLGAQGAQSITLWGVRAGCLLAIDTLSTLDPGAPSINNLILWQPVTSGETFLKQFLRLKVAAAMMDGERLAVSDLFDASRKGESIEVAGYALSPSLVEQMSAVSMKKMAVPASITVCWIEIATS